MPYNSRGRDSIPIKIGGWDGRFTVEKPVLKEGYSLVSHNKKKYDPNAIPTPRPVAQAPNSAPREQQRQQWQEAPNGREHVINVERYDRDEHDNQQGQCNNNTSRPAPKQYASGNQFYKYNTETEVLPVQWDGTFAGRPNPKQYNKNLNDSSTQNFYGYNTEPEILPTQWSGKFEGAPVKYTRDLNDSSAQNFYGYSNEPIILPVQWSGKFETDPNDVRMRPERNRSDAENMHGYNNECEVLPVQWDGKFQLDPTDVRIKPERNRSDLH